MRPVYIKWIDAAFYEPQLAIKEVLELAQPEEIVRTVGWLLKRTKTTTIVTRDLMTGGKSCRATEFIPNQMILKFKRLK